MKRADLHIHTIFSDSSLSPQEVVDQAHDANIACIAITDHDTVGAIAAARGAAEASGIELITGIELSTELNGRDIHMLGYCFDEEDEEFIRLIDGILDMRAQRMIMIINRLKELGVGNIDFDEVKAKAGSRSIGRPHLAQVMVEKGVVSSVQEAFNRYLADDAPGYVTKFKQTPAEGIGIIKRAGGVSVLAHPMVTRMDEIIPSLVAAGLDGLEVYYPNTSDSITQHYAGIARKHGLLMTGGSDAHGAIKTNTHIGKTTIPYALVEQLKERAQR
jgi:predicted metal-dependent phosphoesterase TrpH